MRNKRMIVMFFTPIIFLAVVACLIDKYTERKHHEELCIIKKDDIPVAYFDSAEKLHVYRQTFSTKKDDDMLRVCPSDPEEIDLTYASQ